MTRRDQRRAAMVVAATLLAFLGALAILGLEAWRYPDTAAGTERRELKVTIARGTALNEIARRLGAEGLIARPTWFRFYANEQGLSQKIRAGQYTFVTPMTPRQVLQKLVEGAPVEELSVTIPEGKNFVEIAAILDSAGVTPRADFLRLCRDAVFLKQLGVPAATPEATIEGYLFPDTYRFRPGTEARVVLTTLVKHTTRVLSELKAAHKEAVTRLSEQFKFGDHEIVLMASLVEKETGEGSERPRIAGVFYNRLRLPTFVPHLLQTDPTIVYGCTVPLVRSEACQRFEGRIRRIHLEDKDNPYNTYTHEGLPPGPIANPGRAALEAAIVPDATPYLYFVSKNDGTHQFSRTRAEHEKAVDRYQRTGP